jgi:hypothetical protein
LHEKDRKGAERSIDHSVFLINTVAASRVRQVGKGRPEEAIKPGWVNFSNTANG